MKFQFFKQLFSVFYKCTCFFGQCFLILVCLNMVKFQNREPLMPSPQFIKSYFSSFTDDIISQPMLKGEKSDEDKDKEGEASEVREK